MWNVTCLISHTMKRLNKTIVNICTNTYVNGVKKISFYLLWTAAPLRSRFMWTILNSSITLKLFNLLHRRLFNLTTVQKSSGLMLQCWLCWLMVHNRWRNFQSPVWSRSGSSGWTGGWLEEIGYILPALIYNRVWKKVNSLSAATLVDVVGKL